MEINDAGAPVLCILVVGSFLTPGNYFLYQKARNTQPNWSKPKKLRIRVMQLNYLLRA